MVSIESRDTLSPTPDGSLIMATKKVDVRPSLPGLFWTRRKVRHAKTPVGAQEVPVASLKIRAVNTFASFSSRLDTWTNDEERTIVIRSCQRDDFSRYATSKGIWGPTRSHNAATGPRRVAGHGRRRRNNWTYHPACFFRLDTSDTSYHGAVGSRLVPSIQHTKHHTRRHAKSTA
jgi:hypothetical protein